MGSNPILSAIQLNKKYLLYQYGDVLKLVKGNTSERVRWTMQRGFVGAAVKIFSRKQRTKILGTARGHEADEPLKRPK